MNVTLNRPAWASATLTAYHAVNVTVNRPAWASATMTAWLGRERKFHRSGRVEGCVYGRRSFPCFSGMGVLYEVAAHPGEGVMEPLAASIS